MDYQIDKQGLLKEIGAWNGFLGRKVILIACGGTALTLLGVKDSTKDIDLMVPRLQEYTYLIKTLEKLGYRPVTGSGWSRGGGFVFDLFQGKRIHTTELLESPLKESNHFLMKEYSRIYLGALNYYDLIISKLFRGTSVDFEDCLTLVSAKQNQIKLEKLRNRYLQTASFDVSEKRVVKNLNYFIKILKEKKIV